jgi:integrase
MGRRSVTGGVSESRGKIRLRIFWSDRELRPTLDLPWTVPNRRAALRMVEEIKQKIRHGIFNPADYFPEYGGIPSTVRATAAPLTFAAYAELYQKALGKKAPATREDYRKQLTAVWLPRLAERPIKNIRYSELVDIVNELEVSGKTLNNYLIPLRGVFAFALKDRAINDNPADGLENAPVQATQPDPFERDEVERILADLAKRDGAQVANYFAAAFFAGFRPSEQIALKWSDVDFARHNVRVQRAIVRGQGKASTKTYVARDVELNERAWAVFEAQRAYTQLADREIFWNPATGRPWADIQTQWKIWRACLKRLGMRYREPYQTRHTYASRQLMDGVNAVYIARQMGHANAQMLFKVYGRWIDGADKSRERDKASAAFRHDTATRSAESHKNTSKSKT